MCVRLNRSVARRLALWGCTLLLTACAGLQKSRDTIGLAVSNVNYSGSGYVAALAVDPVTDQSGGGEAANEYAAGGRMCCYSLPAKWHPGIRVEVRLMLPTKAKNYQEYETMPDVWESHLVELPPYPPTADTLWIVIYPDQQVAVYATRVTPGHPDWPGKIKGWPVPSVEYRRMLWDRRMQFLKKQIADFRKGIVESPEDAELYKKALNSANREIQLLGKRP